MTEGIMLGRFEAGPEGTQHIFPVPVYWEDTDAGGIVYYANYLKFTERARTDMLRGLGINQQEMLVEEGANFVVRACTIEYLSPARMEDQLEIITRVTSLRGASLHMRQDICRDDEILVETTVRVACLGDGGKPQRLSSAINDKFNALLGYSGLLANTTAREE
jgi:acyl-CoA thioester hydrolase